MPGTPLNFDPIAKKQELFFRVFGTSGFILRIKLLPGGLTPIICSIRPDREPPLIPRRLLIMHSNLATCYSI